MYSLFFIILKKSGIESLQSWIESESISLQQGNFLSSVTKTQKILLKSDVVKGIALFNIQHNPPEMPVGFGLTPQIEIISEVNKIQVVQSGFLTFSLFFRFRDYPNMMIGFFVYSKSLSIFFCIFSLLLFASLYIFYFQGRLFALTESKQKETLFKIEKENVERMSVLAAQVSHDIRSPLMALNVIVSELDKMPEEKRILVRSAVQRINDVANQLLQGTRVQHEKTPIQPTNQYPAILLSTVIDYLVTEKRVQFREKQNICIEADLSQSYGLFARINQNELKRVLSNLINNSCEAFDNECGKVTIALRGYSKKITITVMDNGKGIPEHILGKLGEKGISYGKDGSHSGSGLGIFHAKKTIEQFQGTFVIQSKANHGTLITMTFSKAENPKWFVEKIDLHTNQQVVVLDDDLSVIEVWRNHFKNNRADTHGISLLNFTSGSEFKKWTLSQTADTLSKVLFLIDYELLNQSKTGLDLIEELKIRAILVTSRFEEKNIVDRCEKLEIGLIPKSMAGLVQLNLP